MSDLIPREVDALIVKKLRDPELARVHNLLIDIAESEGLPVPFGNKKWKVYEE